MYVSHNAIFCSVQECCADDRQDDRRIAKFAQYAMAASEMALRDAGWAPQKEEDLEATVRGFLSHLH